MEYKIFKGEFDKNYSIVDENLFESLLNAGKIGYQFVLKRWYLLSIFLLIYFCF